MLDRLRGLFELAHDLPDFQNAVTATRAISHRARIVAPAKGYFLAGIADRRKAPLLVVTAHPQRSRELYSDLRSWGADALFFGQPDVLFYERLRWDRWTSEQRLGTLARLASWSAEQKSSPIVVTSATALMHRLMSPERFICEIWTLKPGDALPPRQWSQRLLRLGYEPVTLVEEPGTFCHRGGVLDVFVPTLEEPTRIELFGDEIESVRRFDPATQRSTGPCDAVTIIPANELLVPDEGGARQIAAVIQDVVRGTRPGGDDPRIALDIARIAEGESFPEIGFYAPYLGEATIFDYLPSPSLVVLDEPEEIAVAVRETIARAEARREEVVALGDVPSDWRQPYLGEEEIQAGIQQRAETLLELSWRGAIDADGGDDPESAFRAAPMYGGDLARVCADCRRWTQAGNRVVIATDHPTRLAEAFLEHDLFAAVATGLPAVPPPGSVTLTSGSALEGFLCAGNPGFVFLTEHELYGRVRRGERARRHAMTGGKLLLSDLAPGNYVVHTDYGIGRFEGIVTQSLNGSARDYLRIAYAGSDHLFLPTDQIDRISRYIGVDDQSPTLNHLGSGDWNRSKAKARAAAQEVARDLVDLAATRSVVQGHAFSPDTPWQRELEAAFPYRETPDQLKAIAVVKDDLEQPRPMDRLICGDVGYGKTEIALRAAFKVVMEGKQAAVLVPTTVLAQQHFTTFRDRLQGFPVRLAMLSRFASEREQTAMLADLQTGDVDIVIGTHRLLQRDVRFKDLGLLVIDEEHRLGVGDKERLKQLRSEVDVLTLTATPIPRTLQMALVGIRELTTLETPPDERLPIRTFVGPFDEKRIRSAILRELARGGQVFFVHNRVQTIQKACQRLQELVPEARFGIAHGQMTEEHLERAMLDFAARAFDVLVCTTIIESGLDIPNANTIVVDHADKLGLAQLYQLRGRVGRSTERAYGYFFYPPGRPLSAEAEQRLQTILAASELGAGFQIAMKDLEIRGAGNLVGNAQHGHVAAVGFHLYCQLLREAVEKIQGKIVPKLPQVALDLNCSAHLTKEYVSDDRLRLNIYQRLASAIDPTTVTEIASELSDRFGPPPPEVCRLLDLVTLRIRAGRLGAIAITQGKSDITVRFAFDHTARLTAILRRFSPAARFQRGVLSVSLNAGLDKTLTLLQNVFYLLHQSIEETSVPSPSPVSSSALVGPRAS